MDKLEERIATHKAKYVVVDSLVKITGDIDENHPSMSLIFDGFRDIADKYGCAIEFIHHGRKSQKRGEQDGDTSRGSTAIDSNMDVVTRVKSDHGSDIITLTQTKGRDDEGAPEMRVKFKYLNVTKVDRRGKTINFIHEADMLVLPAEKKTPKADKKDGKYEDAEIQDLVVYYLQRQDPTYAAEKTVIAKALVDAGMKMSWRNIADRIPKLSGKREFLPLEEVPTSSENRPKYRLKAAYRKTCPNPVDPDI